MLGDVMKVPHRNRPNRSLIRMMLVAAKHSNNVFSGTNVSFRRLSHTVQKNSIENKGLLEYLNNKQDIKEESSLSQSKKRVTMNYSRTIPM